jgi:hypothetical protein
MKYKIQKNIPIPQKPTNQCEYPFSEMNIGDSFLCSNSEKARSAAKKYGYTVTIRRTNEDVLKGYRVWRINKGV